MINCPYCDTELMSSDSATGESNVGCSGCRIWWKSNRDAKVIMVRKLISDWRWDWIVLPEGCLIVSEKASWDMD